jgi:hypothetical protein
MEHFNLDEAVHAGVIRSDQADALRRFDEDQRHAPGATEERFALISGFADAMAAVGILMVAGTLVGTIGSSFPPGCAIIPFACWWAATYFTAKRRLMLSSFVLFGTFALTAAMTVLGIALIAQGLNPLTASPYTASAGAFIITAAATAIACFAWWRRFELAIAFAAFAVALVNIGINICRSLFPGMPGIGVDVVEALCGPILFIWAMWWDMSDVRRETVRSDVAFWLHIAAGFLIVKSAMTLVLGHEGNADGWGRMFKQIADPGQGQAATVVSLFLVFALIALIIDRRSLLTSGMFYAVPATIALFGGVGPGAIGIAFLLCGVTLTFLAVRWTDIRERLLRLLPDRISAQLPRPQLKAIGPRPAY